MKSKIVAISIFSFLLLCLCVFEVLITHDTIEKVKTTNYEVIELAYNNEETEMQLYDRLTDIATFWAKRENFLCLIFNHKDMVEIGKEFEQAKSYLKLNNKNEAIVHLELLAEDILSMEHIVFFNLPNLF